MAKKRKSKDYTGKIIGFSVIPMTILFIYIGFWKGLLLLVLSLFIHGSSGEELADTPYEQLNSIQKLCVVIFGSFCLVTGLKVILIVFSFLFGSGGSTYSYEDCLKLGLFQGIDPGVILGSCENYK